MVILGGLVFLPVAWVGAIGVLVIFAHNALAPLLGKSAVLYGGWMVPLGGIKLVVLYTIVPWFAVMAAGYAFGTLIHRRRLVLTMGVAAIVLFLVLRATGVYGDPHPWEGGALKFLNPAKYPASLQFLLMTLGPMFIALLCWRTRVGASFGGSRCSGACRSSITSCTFPSSMSSPC
jgi:uncharacterized membrane protein